LFVRFLAELLQVDAANGERRVVEMNILQRLQRTVELVRVAMPRVHHVFHQPVERRSDAFRADQAFHITNERLVALVQLRIARRVEQHIVGHQTRDGTEAAFAELAAEVR